MNTYEIVVRLDSGRLVTYVVNADSKRFAIVKVNKILRKTGFFILSVKVLK